MASPLLVPVMVGAARKTTVPSDRPVAPSPEALAEVSNLIQNSRGPSISLVKKTGNILSQRSSPEARPVPDDELPTVFALAEQASPLPLHKVDNTSSSFTPWGYKAVQKECTSGTSSSSWQEVRAGLLSPPPLAAALLSSPVRPFADSGDEARQPDEDEENEASDRHDEQSTTGTGRGGWLVSLVDYLQPVAPEQNGAA